MNQREVADTEVYKYSSIVIDVDEHAHDDLLGIANDGGNDDDDTDNFVLELIGDLYVAAEGNGDKPFRFSTIIKDA